MQGKFLISNPFLSDESFSRSVIAMLQHSADESFGLMINKKMPYTVEDINIGIVHSDIPLYYGGPVETDRLFFLHKTESLAGAIEVGNGLYWNGDLNELRNMLELELILPADIRFYLGYSGWGAHQLEDELEEDSWIVAPLDANIVFSTASDDDLWREALEHLGEPYSELALYPIDPSMN